MSSQPITFNQKSLNMKPNLVKKKKEREKMGILVSVIEVNAFLECQKVGTEEKLVVSDLSLPKLGYMQLKYLLEFLSALDIAKK